MSGRTAISVARRMLLVTMVRLCPDVRAICSRARYRLVVLASTMIDSPSLTRLAASLPMAAFYACCMRSRTS